MHYFNLVEGELEDLPEFAKHQNDSKSSKVNKMVVRLQ